MTGQVAQYKSWQKWLWTRWKQWFEPMWARKRNAVDTAGCCTWVILQYNVWSPALRPWPTPQLVGVLWIKNQPATETWQYTTLRHPRPQWDSNPQTLTLDRYTFHQIYSAYYPLQYIFRRKWVPIFNKHYTPLTASWPVEYAAIHSFPPLSDSRSVNTFKMLQQYKPCAQ